MRHKIQEISGKLTFPKKGYNREEYANSGEERNNNQKLILQKKKNSEKKMFNILKSH